MLEDKGLSNTDKITEEQGSVRWKVVGSLIGKLRRINRESYERSLFCDIPVCTLAIYAA